MHSLYCEPKPAAPPLVRCLAVGNHEGNGITATTRELLECIACDNRGIGLSGRVLEECLANGNLGTGLVGYSAIGCKAWGNGGSGIHTSGSATACIASQNRRWGVRALGNVSDTTSTWNGVGISGADVVGSLANQNGGVGILASGHVTRCWAELNGGWGILGSNVTDSVVVRNGLGLESSDSLLRCTVAENRGSGATGGTVDSSVVRHNVGDAVVTPDRVKNSWILGNQGRGVVFPGRVEYTAIENNNGHGIEGKISPPYSTVAHSTIRNNVASGVRSSGVIATSNVYGNGRYDYEETRLFTQLERVNLFGNFWGADTTQLMNAHPWPSYDRDWIPGIYDFMDDTTLCEVQYGGHLSAEVPDAHPDNRPPAFLWTVNPSPSEHVGVGRTTFTLVFSKPMDAGRPLSVTFGLIEPFTAHVVEPISGFGWSSATIWRGAYAIESETGEGKNTLRVSGAKSIDSFLLPDDTAHSFVINTGRFDANNGMILVHEGTKLRVSWDENGKPATALGYNVHRSPSGLVGTYRKLNESVIHSNFLEDETAAIGQVHFYLVYIVDSMMNATQWLPPLVYTPRSSVPDWRSYE